MREKISKKIVQLIKKAWYAGVSVEISSLHPFQLVEKDFWIYGRVPKFWLEYGKYGLGIEWLDINGSMFGGQGTNLYPNTGLLDRLQRKVQFSAHISFPNISGPFIYASGGRITLDINGKGDYSFYLPVILKGFDPDPSQGIDLQKKHSDGIKRVIKCKSDQKKYHMELENLYEGRRRRYEDALALEKSNESGIVELEDDKVLDGVFEILQSEDPERVALDEKYKELLAWSGPLLHGRVGRMSGFVFTVYSDDHHPLHFHVLHRGRGIDARFSFPQIQLISYKNSKNTIGSKDVDHIQEFFQDSENFKKLEAELVRTGRVAQL
ncbi:MAG: hypothetical protein A3J46_04070 [Candidatus Yanofskybacteria bacterium RIFCSPHIGHO2_02_FULL_41_11]|uniref:DUF4160 domain-containing protein n=1 Tax=Candidatus Yanofskybacteria bacterium RIFCSPHIGHO2_02_FULL_41_11 TaxID=1802675 RepID=A0A1F8FA53_9BACT|nr:MAG: hypothetical protein A3J46_04070 [Candidatus Yanofskybacteria bacterium RIFCSPHIGHO2_02_FULL_41_11]